MMSGIGAKADSINVDLSNVEVTAIRPHSMTGVAKISIDSTALRRNISQSMAEALSFNPSVFVKSTSRASTATVSLRGSSPTHTAVIWNGIPINSTMTGFTDFSLIPAWMMDRADIFYGSSSTTLTSGAIGGAVSLTSSLASLPSGFSATYTQGMGSFTTFDEFLSLGYANEQFSSRTRVALSTSRNDFSFVNHDKKLNIYDDNHNIIGQYYPREHNHGAFTDLHLLQQLSYSFSPRQTLSLDLWYIHSGRDIPLTTVDYSADRQTENHKQQNTLRSILSYRHTLSPVWQLKAHASVIHSHDNYLYALDNSSGILNRLTDSHTSINQAKTTVEALFAPSQDISVSIEGSFSRQSISSADRASLLATNSWDAHRNQGELTGSLRWQLAPSAGLSANYRQQFIRDSSPLSTVNNQSGLSTPVTLSLLADWQVSAKLYLHSSASRNSSTPTLSDLYFIPGGNPTLRPERSLSADFGANLTPFADLQLSANTYFTRTTDLILWLPTPKGFFTPENVNRVNAYGIELTGNYALQFNPHTTLSLRATYSWTPTRNRTHPTSDADKSFGRQLPYIPLHTASFTPSIHFHALSATYRLCYYSRRWTMSSNESAPTGTVPHYLVSDLTFDYRFDRLPLTPTVKLALNNLFNADYITVLAHPMPGFNFELYLSFTI